jgi:hypothetical protein
MTILFYVGLICVFVLFLVIFAAVTQWAERKWPALGRWLDRFMPEHEWTKPW